MPYLPPLLPCLGQRDNALRIALGSRREIQSYIWDSQEYEGAVMMIVMMIVITTMMMIMMILLVMIMMILMMTMMIMLVMMMTTKISGVRASGYLPAWSTSDWRSQRTRSDLRHHHRHLDQHHPAQFCEDLV